MFKTLDIIYKMLLEKPVICELEDKGIKQVLKDINQYYV